MKILFIIIFVFILSIQSYSQSKWKRSEPILENKQTIFKSTQTFNLPTSEVIPKGDLVYGISHRFSGPVSGGYSTFFGLDNGAFMRMLLAYGVTDKLMLTLGRTNHQATVDFQAKYKLLHSDINDIPIMLSVNAGVSYIGKSQVKITNSGKEFQPFLTLVANTKLFDRLAIGLSPSFLNNTISHCECETHSILLGSYLQYYFNDDMTSIILEGVNTLQGWRGDGVKQFYDTYSAGVEFETGGHFFKLLLTNSSFINQSQVFGGSPNPFSLKNLTFGFQITRNFGL